MAFKQGEVYRCPDPDCGCEIQYLARWRGSAPVCAVRASAPDGLLNKKKRVAFPE